MRGETREEERWERRTPEEGPERRRGGQIGSEQSVLTEDTVQCSVLTEVDPCCMF